MMLGLGQATAQTNPVAGSAALQPATVPGFTDGLKAWLSPGQAFSALTSSISHPSIAFSSKLLPATLGLLAVPAGALVLVLSLVGGATSKRGRRR
jgi:hypothetical protein